MVSEKSCPLISKCQPQVRVVIKLGNLHKHIVTYLANSWDLINGCCCFAKSYPTLCDPVDCSMPGLPAHHQLSEFTQTYVH